MSALQQVADIVVYANAGLSLSFLVEYHIMSHGAWRRSVTGILIMGWVLVHFVIFAMLATAHVFGWLASQTWYQWLYLVTVGAISGAIFGFGVLMWRVNRNPLHEPPKDRC